MALIYFRAFFNIKLKGRKMDKNKILEQIQINKLGNLDYEFLISQLCVLNNKTFEEIKKYVDQLIFEKLIFWCLCKQGKYSFV